MENALTNSNKARTVCKALSNNDSKFWAYVRLKNGAETFADFENFICARMALQGVYDSCSEYGYPSPEVALIVGKFGSKWPVRFFTENNF